MTKEKLKELNDCQQTIEEINKFLNQRKGVHSLELTIRTNESNMGSPFIETFNFSPDQPIWKVIKDELVKMKERCEKTLYEA